MKDKPCIIGIDFGTTSLSAIVINVENRSIEKVICYNTDAYIPFVDPNRKEQSIEQIESLFFKLIAEITSIPNILIQAYGFTGQMHGIIGLSKEGKAVTNLVTWQDKTGETILDKGHKLIDEIKALSNDHSLANGYGIITLYKWIKYDMRTDIYSFSTVADYFAQLLAGKSKNVINSTMAHSIGLFNLHTNNWNWNAIEKLGLKKDLFPEIVDCNYIVGHKNDQNTNNPIPITCAIGDNQASFMGSIANNDKSILLNIGTGTQLSFLVNKEEIDVFEKYIDGAYTQARPFDNKFYLVATSFINGGTVYKSLYNFFREIGQDILNVNAVEENIIWKNMERAARECFDKQNKLQVVPSLEEERKKSDEKASINNLRIDNFHPGDFVIGFLTGLAEYYKRGCFPELNDRINLICGGGNGLKRNKLFCEIIEKTFKQPLFLTSYNEEAAVGAALNAAIAANVLNTEEGVVFLSDLSK